MSEGDFELAREQQRENFARIRRLDDENYERELLARVRVSSTKRLKATLAWREAMLDAYNCGVSLRIIGEAAGISHVRVLQIVRDQRSA